MKITWHLLGREITAVELEDIERTLHPPAPAPKPKPSAAQKPPVERVSAWVSGSVKHTGRAILRGMLR